MIRACTDKTKNSLEQKLHASSIRPIKNNFIRMKKIAVIIFILLSVIACKKKTVTPEGPTDVRVRNLSDQTFQELTVITSEKPGDTLNIGTITGGSVSVYSRFNKAYPKAEISANINLSGNIVKFTTGPVSFTYMQYIGPDRITFEVNISDPVAHSLIISNIIEEAPISVK